MKRQTTKSTASKKKIETGAPDLLHGFYAGLKKAVEETGLSSYALAKKLGFDKQAISNLVKGGRDPKFSTAVRIIKAMRISMDTLLGITPAKTNDKVVQPKTALEVEIKTEKIDFINKITKMHDQDVELLEAIACILDDRRSRAMAKLLHAVKDANPLNKLNKKEGLMAKASESLKKPKVNGSLSDDDFEDDDFEYDFGDEDDDLNDEFDDDNFNDDFDDDDDDFDDNG